MRTDIREHVVEPGDSLATLSQCYYGTTAHWAVIFQHNRDIMASDPNQLVWGTRLVIPHIPNLHG